MRDVEILFNSLIEELKMEFKTVEYVCLTADCWTVFHKAYIGVTVHWLDDNLERHSKALACRRMFGRHTYDNIAEILDRIINEFHLQNKITLIVTDNASNFVKAFKIFNENSEITEILSKEDENEEVVRSVEIFDILDNVIVENLDCLTLPPHQRCAAHTLNLIATVDILAAENEGAYKRISRRVFGKCQLLFNKQNQSSQSADQIKAILGRYLLTPNATRWNSFYDSINLLCENIEKMDDVCAKLQVPFFTKPQDVDFINEYCKVMKPIARGLDILQGDKQISIGFLLPTISAINRAYDHIVNLKYCRPLVRALILVPKFKLNWAKPQEKIDIRQRLIDYLIENIGEEDSVYTASQTSLVIEQHTESESEDDFLSFKVTATSGDNENIQMLVDNYLSNTSIKSPNDLPMQLKKAYFKFNTAIPSSAPVERLFSGGGHLMDKKRGKMADKNFEMTLLLKHNKYLKC
ncbi:hypothetical protein QTP88_022580 [Uroleucon formosanum]